MDSSDSEVFKNVLDVVFITSGTDLIRILRNVLKENSNEFGIILDFDI